MNRCADKLPHFEQFSPDGAACREQPGVCFAGDNYQNVDVTVIFAAEVRTKSPDARYTVESSESGPNCSPNLV